MPPSATPFAAPVQQLPPSPAGGLLRVILALLVVLAAVLAAAWLARRMRSFSGGGGSSLELLAQLSLGARERAVLLRVGDCRLLIGVAPGNVRTLHVLEKSTPLEVASTPPSGAAPAGEGAEPAHVQVPAAQEPRQMSVEPSMPRQRLHPALVRMLLPALLLLPMMAHAAAGAAAGAMPGIPAFAVQNSGGGQTYTLTIQLLALMTAITLLPAALLMMTAFTRIIIVLSILRQAIGAGQSPPNQVLIGLALFLTLFVMSPVIDKIRTDAVTPYMAGTIDTSTRARARRRAAQDLHARADARERHRGLRAHLRRQGICDSAGGAADASWCRRSSPAS